MITAQLGQLINNDAKVSKTDGQVMIGGLVAIHDAGGVNNLNCDSAINSYGIQRLEAMRYAVNKVLIKSLVIANQFLNSFGWIL